MHVVAAYGVFGSLIFSYIDAVGVTPQIPSLYVHTDLCANNHVCFSVCASSVSCSCSII